MDCEHSDNYWLMKRHNNGKNEIPTVNAGPWKPIPFSFGDRFIPRRRCLIHNNRNQKLVIKNSDKDILNVQFTLNSWRQKVLTLALNAKFGIKERRVLELSDTKSETYNASTDMDNGIFGADLAWGKVTEIDWQCRPRLKPLIVAEATHEMPGFTTNLDNNLIDWSVNGHIVACFGTDIFIWKRLENVTNVLDTMSPNSLAYCPNGKYLAVGCQFLGFPLLELWDVSNCLYAINGKRFQGRQSKVVCIAWNKSGNHIVCGTQIGTIFVHTVPDLNVIRKLQHHNTSIRMIKFSSTQRYFASSDVEGTVIVYHWNSCAIHLQVRSIRKIAVMFDWHPWNGLEMVIAEESPPSIIILHVPLKKIVACYQRSDNDIMIDSVNFNKITGEMLVSIRKILYPNLEETKVLVLSSLDQIVDVIEVEESGARFLVASPDGSRVATIGKDESITIWAFCHKAVKSTGNVLKQRREIPEHKKHLSFEYFGIQFKKWSLIK